MLQFIKYVFATITGLFLFVILGLLLLAGIAASAGQEKTAEVKPNSVLQLDLNYAIPEKSSDNPFTGFLSGDFNAKRIIGLTEIRATIAHAAQDNNIKGIYLKLGWNNNGYATLEALRDELKKFKTSGKFVYAYGTMISQKSYYLSTVADKIFINPSGLVELKGFGREISYYKNMFDKMGVEVQDFHCGAYKSAIEPFIRNNMSDANREQLTLLYGDVYHQFLTNIAQDRKIDSASLNSIVNDLLAETPEKDKEFKLIDDVAFYDQVADAMKAKIGVDKSKDLEMINLSQYATTVKENLSSDNRIAVVYAEGEIVDGKGKEGQIGGDEYAKLIAKLRKDDKVKAIVLRVNSPGGSALASDIMWRELVLAKKEKPLVVSFGDVAASGGYFISCMGDRIFAQPNTITGSIGVFGLIPNAQKLFTDKLGVTFDRVKVTKHGVLGGITSPLDAEESAIAQRNVEKTYREFKEHVAEGRGKDTAYIETIAQGRVWTGKQALANGLVDELGGLDDAVAFAAQKANLKEYRTKSYPIEKSWSEKLTESFSDAKTEWVKQELGEQYEVYETLHRLKQMKGTQMRMVYQLGL